MAQIPCPLTLKTHTPPAHRFFLVCGGDFRTSVGPHHPLARGVQPTIHPPSMYVISARNLLLYRNGVDHERRGSRPHRKKPNAPQPKAVAVSEQPHGESDLSDVSKPATTAAKPGKPLAPCHITMSKRVFFLFLSDLLTSACTLLLLLVLICSVLRCLRLLFLRLLLLLLRLHVFFCTFLRGVAHTHTPDAHRSGGGDSRLCFLVYNCADRSGLPETRAGIRTRF